MVKVDGGDILRRGFQSSETGAPKASIFYAVAIN